MRAKARKEIDLDSIVGPEKAEKLRGLESDPDLKDTITSMYRLSVPKNQTSHRAKRTLSLQVRSSTRKT